MGRTRTPGCIAVDEDLRQLVKQESRPSNHCVKATQSCQPRRSATVRGGMHTAFVSHAYRPGDVLLLKCPVH